jgi:hypothetical protein
VWFNFNFFDSIDDLLESWSAPNSTLRSGWEWKRPSKEGVAGQVWECRNCLLPGVWLLQAMCLQYETRCMRTWPLRSMSPPHTERDRQRT